MGYKLLTDAEHDAAQAEAQRRWDHKLDYMVRYGFIEGVRWANRSKRDPLSSPYSPKGATGDWTNEPTKK